MPKKYDPEFRKNAITYAETHKDLDRHTIAQNLGVPFHTLYGWVKEYHRQQRVASQGNPNIKPVTGNLTPEEKEILRLKKELQDTKDALQILKKAIGILGK